MSKFSVQKLSEVLPSGLLVPKDFALADCLLYGSPLNRSHSIIFFCKCPRYPTPVALKWCVQPHTLTPDSDGASYQFKALQAVYERMNGATNFTVPHPYELWEEQGLIVTEWIDGQSMVRNLFSWRCGSVEAGKLMAKAAKWLRQFHRAHVLSRGELDIDDKLAVLDRIDEWSIAKEDMFRRGALALRKAACAAGKVKLQRSWIHGDFKADNLIIAKSRVVGIDVHVKHCNAVVYDLASFMNHLDLSAYRPGAWRWGMGRETLLHRFQHDYFAENHPGIDLSLIWVRLFLALAAWSNMVAGPSSKARVAVLSQRYRSTARRLSLALNAYCS